MASRVLIVDDEPAVCDLIKDILSEVRLTGVCANKDIDAYRIIATPPTIKGLIVDVNLGPGTTGFDVARYARQVIPDLPVVYVTGDATQTSFCAFGVPGSVFVEKPFDVGDLLARLLDLMDFDSGGGSDPEDQTRSLRD